MHNYILQCIRGKITPLKTKFIKGVENTSFLKKYIKKFFGGGKVTGLLKNKNMILLFSFFHSKPGRVKRGLLLLRGVCGLTNLI